MRLILISWIMTLGAAGLLAGRAFASDDAAAAKDVVELLDATRIEGELTSLTDRQLQIRVEGEVRNVAVADVASITFAQPADLMAKQGQEVVTTGTGHILAARGIVSDKAKLKFRNGLLGDVELDFRELAVIYLPEDLFADQIEKRCQRASLVVGGFDMLVVEGKSGNWIGLEGILEGLTAEDVLFKWGGEVRKKKRKGVQAIRLVATGKHPPAAGVLVGAWGTTVRFAALRFADNKFLATIPGLRLEKREIDRQDVATIRFESDRIVRLADLKPTKVKEYGFFGEAFDYRRNLSVSGKPLRIAGKTYATGLGLHSFCELTYDLDGKYAKFVTIPGIDDAVRPRGNAELTLLADGRQLHRVHLRGTDKAPEVIRIDVTGKKTLVIRVDFGEDELGVGDHVNLGDARLIK